MFVKLGNTTSSTAVMLPETKSLPEMKPTVSTTETFCIDADDRVCPELVSTTATLRLKVRVQLHKRRVNPP